MSSSKMSSSTKSSCKNAKGSTSRLAAARDSPVSGKTGRSTKCCKGGSTKVGDWADDRDLDAECEDHIRNNASLRYALPQDVDITTMCAIRNAMSSTPGKERMNAKQLKELKELMEEKADLKPQLSAKYLRCCKVILGRWLRPSEAAALFGDATVFRQEFQAIKLGEKDPDVFLGHARRSSKKATSSNNTPHYERDARISHIIGKQGATLNFVTRRSSALYIWFSSVRGQVIVRVYVSAKDAKEAATKTQKARRLINGISKKFRGQPGKANGAITKGLALRANNKSPSMRLQQVPIKAVYKDLAFPELKPKP
jgi:hypothetical protein